MGSSELAVKILFSSIVVIALLQSNIFSTLSTAAENVNDGKDDEVYEKIINCLQSK